MSKLQVAIAGLGRMGARHALHFNNLTPRAQVIAVTSPRPEELEWAKKNIEGARTYLDYDEMLRSEPSLQAVVVASATSVHAEQAIKAINKGLHVLCEKPLSTRVEEVCGLFDLFIFRPVSNCILYRAKPLSTPTAPPNEAVRRRKLSAVSAVDSMRRIVMRLTRCKAARLVVRVCSARRPVTSWIPAGSSWSMRSSRVGSLSTALSTILIWLCGSLARTRWSSPSLRLASRRSHRSCASTMTEIMPWALSNSTMAALRSCSAAE